MLSYSNNEKIMIGNETYEIFQEIFDYLLQKYQTDLEEKMNSKEFIFDSVDLLHYKLHEISLNHSGSYIDSPKLLKKRVTINPKNNYDITL